MYNYSETLKNMTYYYYISIRTDFFYLKIKILSFETFDVFIWILCLYSHNLYRIDMFWKYMKNDFIYKLAYGTKVEFLLFSDFSGQEPSDYPILVGIKKKRSKLLTKKINYKLNFLGKPVF